MKIKKIDVFESCILTHRGHICISKLSIIGSDNVLLPGRRQAIIWTNAANIVNWNLRSNFQWNLKRNSCIFLQENAFENVVCKQALWNFDSWAKFHIEGQGQSTLILKGILIKVFRMFFFNLMALAWTGEEFSLGQAWVWHTVTHKDTLTNMQTQATTILTDQNWPRMKPAKLLRKSFNVG